MKNTILIILFLSSGFSSAQNAVDLNVIYENANTQVETGQQGAVLLTVTNPTTENISVSVGKSFNFYENNRGPFVSVYNPEEQQITDACQWQYGAYSPWPPWTDGYILSIEIDNIPPMSSVTCEGEYLIGMIDGEQHTVEWFLRNINNPFDLVDTQADTFRVGPPPPPVNVPTTQWWSNFLLGTIILLISLYLLPRVKFNSNQH